MDPSSITNRYKVSRKMIYDKTLSLSERATGILMASFCSSINGHETKSAILSLDYLQSIYGKNSKKDRDYLEWDLKILCHKGYFSIEKTRYNNYIYITHSLKDNNKINYLLLSRDDLIKILRTYQGKRIDTRNLAIVVYSNVLSCISYNTNNTTDAICYKTISQIAEEVGLKSEDSISRTLNKLCDNNIISFVKIKTKENFSKTRRIFSSYSMSEELKKYAYSQLGTRYKKIINYTQEKETNE